MLLSNSGFGCSLDGVPFLMRDRTLRRTTNVRRVFPERQYDDASLFNWTDLSSLNAGQWFLKVWAILALNSVYNVHLSLFTFNRADFSDVVVLVMCSYLWQH